MGYPLKVPLSAVVRGLLACSMPHASPVAHLAQTTELRGDQGNILHTAVFDDTVRL